MLERKIHRNRCKTLRHISKVHCSQYRSMLTTHTIRVPILLRSTCRLGSVITIFVLFSLWLHPGVPIDILGTAHLEKKKTSTPNIKCIVSALMLDPESFCKRDQYFHACASIVNIRYENEFEMCADTSEMMPWNKIQRAQSLIRIQKKIISIKIECDCSMRSEMCGIGGFGVISLFAEVCVCVCVCDCIKSYDHFIFMAIYRRCRGCGIKLIIC